MAFQVYS